MSDYRVSDNTDFSEDALRNLAEAFNRVFPQIEYEFGHVLFSDYNFDLADGCIESIDEFYEDVKRVHGESYTKVARDAAWHMLHVFKIIQDVNEAEAD